MSTSQARTTGLVGKKLGMSHIFDANGAMVPVTILQVGPCVVTDVRSLEKHGYQAVQLGFEPKKAQRVNKPMKGHFKRAGKGCFYHLKEIRFDTSSVDWAQISKEVRVGDVFSEGDWVDISGVSKGRGFAGVVKRFGARGQTATRGTHEYRRNIGSVGCRKSPGRIFKNKKMPGHMGVKKVTVQNIRVVKCLPEHNLMLVKGAVPGAVGSVVIVRKAVKKSLAKAKE